MKKGFAQRVAQRQPMAPKAVGWPCAKATAAGRKGSKKKSAKPSKAAGSRSSFTTDFGSASQPSAVSFPRTSEGRAPLTSSSSSSGSASHPAI